MWVEMGEACRGRRVISLTPSAKKISAKSKRTDFALAPKRELQSVGLSMPLAQNPAST